MRKKGTSLGMLLLCATLFQGSWALAQEGEQPGDTPEAAEPGDAPEVAEPSDAPEAAESSDAPEVAEPSDAPEVAEEPKTKEETEGKSDEAERRTAVGPPLVQPALGPPLVQPAPAEAVSPIPAPFPALVLEPTTPPFEFVDYNQPRGEPRWDNYLVWPVLDTLAVNLTIWNLNLLGSATFPNISPSSLGRAFTNRWEWDDSRFETNQFAHPWQGGLYFATGRANNLGFWASSIYAVFGSVQWEMMMETESPSVPDFWMTTFGGVLMGEVLYRVSNLMLDESETGAGRGWTEFLAGLFSPINGLDRLYEGRTGELGPPPVEVPYKFSVRAGLGSIPLGLGPEFTQLRATRTAGVGLEYGDIFSKDQHRIPYEQFDGHFSLQWKLGDNPIMGAEVDATGVLRGWRFGEKKNFVFGFFQNYEFFTNGTAEVFGRETRAGLYSFGQTSLGPGLRYFTPLGKRTRLDVDFKLMPIILGALSSPAAFHESGRSYNYGVGGTARLKLKLEHQRLGYFQTAGYRYSLVVLNGASGKESVGTWNNELFFNLLSGHGILLNAIMYDRESYYDDYDDIIEHFWVGRVSYRKEW